MSTAPVDLTLARRLDSQTHPPLARRVPETTREVISRRPEDARARDQRAPARVGALAVHDLLRGAASQTREPLELADGQPWNVGDEVAEPVGNGVGHDEHNRHRRVRSSIVTLQSVETKGRISGMGARRLASYENPIANRLYQDGKISLRELSRRAGLSETTAQKVCNSLENGDGDVGLETLTALAAAMDRPLKWLLFGEQEPASTFGDQPGWNESAREAVERFGADAAIVKSLGAAPVFLPPPKVDVLFVVELAKLWRG